MLFYDLGILVVDYLLTVVLGSILVGLLFFWLFAALVSGCLGQVWAGLLGLAMGFLSMWAISDLENVDGRFLHSATGVAIAVSKDWVSVPFRVLGYVVCVLFFSADERAALLVCGAALVDAMSSLVGLAGPFTGSIYGLLMTLIYVVESAVNFGAPLGQMIDYRHVGWIERIALYVFVVLVSSWAHCLYCLRRIRLHSSDNLTGISGCGVLIFFFLLPGFGQVAVGDGSSTIRTLVLLVALSPSVFAIGRYYGGIFASGGAVYSPRGPVAQRVRRFFA